MIRQFMDISHIHNQQHKSRINNLWTSYVSIINNINNTMHKSTIQIYIYIFISKITSNINNNNLISTVYMLPASYSTILIIPMTMHTRRLNTLVPTTQYYGIASLGNLSMLTSFVKPPNIWSSTSASYLTTKYRGFAFIHHISCVTKYVSIILATQYPGVAFIYHISWMT